MIKWTSAYFIQVANKSSGTCSEKANKVVTIQECHCEFYIYLE